MEVQEVGIEAVAEFVDRVGSEADGVAFIGLLAVRLDDQLRSGLGPRRADEADVEGRGLAADEGLELRVERLVVADGDLVEVGRSAVGLDAVPVVAADVELVPGAMACSVRPGFASSRR